MNTVAIIGASLAGLSAARAARAAGYGGRLVIIGEEHERPYDRPPLSKDFLLGRIGVPELSLEDEDEALDAEWVLGRRATGLDGENKVITLDDGTTVEADGIVIATGASARSLPEMAGYANVFSLRTLEDARQLAGELQRGRHLVIVGAGFIGAEVASTASALGLEVTLVNADPTPFAAALGDQMGEVVAGLQEASGIGLLRSTTIQGVESLEHRVVGVHLSDGRYVPADVILVGIGAVPNTGWLGFSGVRVERGGVVCDAAGRTSVPGIVAAGDCAAWHDDLVGTHRRVEHWTTAKEQGTAAMTALLGQDPAAQPAPHYFWSEQHGVRIQFTGNAASADRVEVEAGSAEGRDLLAVYYRGAEPVAVLAMNQPRLFVRWRKSLARALATAAASAVPVTIPA